MSLFLSVDFKIFNQGVERFSVHSRGNQCAFMSLTIASFSPKYSYIRVVEGHALIMPS